MYAHVKAIRRSLFWSTLTLSYKRFANVVTALEITRGIVIHSRVCFVNSLQIRRTYKALRSAFVGMHHSLTGWHIKDATINIQTSAKTHTLMAMRAHHAVMVHLVTTP